MTSSSFEPKLYDPNKPPSGGGLKQKVEKKARDKNWRSAETRSVVGVANVEVKESEPAPGRVEINPVSADTQAVTEPIVPQSEAVTRPPSDEPIEVLFDPDVEETQYSKEQLQSLAKLLKVADENVDVFKKNVQDYKIPPPIAAKLVKDYDILSELGRGGMGVVFKAKVKDKGVASKTKEKKDDVFRAIKLMQKPFRKDEMAEQRFEQEAKAPARLPVHQNIVKVYDRGETDEGAWSVTEFSGDSLGNILEKEGPMKPLDAIKLIKGLAEGLEVVHKNGLAHRDIKDDNIFVPQKWVAKKKDEEKRDKRKEGKGLDLKEAKLGDFGLVTFLSDSEIDKAGSTKLSDRFKLDRAGEVSGTFEYMSPEVVKGGIWDKDRDKALQSSDVYALGVVFYKMLTGDVPYTNDSISQLFEEIRKGHAKSPADINPEIPTEVSDLVMDMIHLDYDKRPKTVFDEDPLTGKQSYLRSRLAKLEKSIQAPPGRFKRLLNKFF